MFWSLLFLLLQTPPTQNPPIKDEGKVPAKKTETIKAPTTKNPRIQTKTIVQKDGKEYPFEIYLPKGYTGRSAVPLIFFLHGSGEREGGKNKPSEVGLGPWIGTLEEDFPFIVVFPRFGENGSWLATGEDAQRAMAILEKVETDYKVDDKRIYLTGLSMGGNGTWELALANPKKWAAIAPLCGYYAEKGSDKFDKSQLSKLKDVPCWCFHGDKDTAVPVSESRKMMAAYWAAGGHPNYTEFPGVPHNCWDMTYKNREFYRWLLSYRLP